MTPTFHRLSTLALALYRNAPRPPRRSIHAQKPARKPPRKMRCVGRKPRGNHAWKKQMLAHAVEMAPVTNEDVRSARERRRWSVDTGKWYRLLNRGSRSAE